LGLLGTTTAKEQKLFGRSKTMKHFLAGLIVVALGAPLRAQKIDTEALSRDRIVQVHTALNHLTVIEVGEPVVTVVTGSPAFKVEWRDNKVFVEPTEPEVSTNLFIWTASSRLNYELEPAGPVDNMDFAIDHPRPVSAPAKVATAPLASLAGAGDPPAGSYGVDLMLGGHPVSTERLRPSRHRVNVWLKDLFEQQDTLFIRYKLHNDTNEVYEARTPSIFLLGGLPHLRFLAGQENLQLSDIEVMKLRAKNQSPLEVVSEKLLVTKLTPGQETVGVVGIKLTSSSAEPRVLRIEFPNDGRGAVGAGLVL